MCHGANAAANLMRVLDANTVGKLDAANASVRQMNSLATTLSEQDKLDITAYLATLP
jgi:cytochrome c553